MLRSLADKTDGEEVSSSEGKNIVPLSTSKTIAQPKQDAVAGFDQNSSGSLLTGWRMVIGGLVLCIAVGWVAARIFAPKINKATPYKASLDQAAAELEVKIALVKRRIGAKPASFRSLQYKQHKQAPKKSPESTPMDKVDHPGHGGADEDQGQTSKLPATDETTLKGVSSEKEQNKQLSKSTPQLSPGRNEEPKRTPHQPRLSLAKPSPDQSDSAGDTEEHGRTPPLSPVVGPKPLEELPKTLDRKPTEPERPPEGDKIPTDTVVTGEALPKVATGRTARDAEEKSGKKNPASQATQTVSPLVIELIQDFETLVNTTESALKGSTIEQASRNNISKAVEKATKLIRNAYTKYPLQPDSEQHLVKAIKKATRLITKALKENITEESTRVRLKANE